MSEARVGDLRLAEGESLQRRETLEVHEASVGDLRAREIELVQPLAAFRETLAKERGELPEKPRGRFLFPSALPAEGLDVLGCGALPAAQQDARHGEQGHQEDQSAHGHRDDPEGRATLAAFGFRAGHGASGIVCHSAPWARGA